MRQVVKNLFALFIIGTIVNSCTKMVSTEQWYSDTKAEILKQSQIKPDSIRTIHESVITKELGYFGKRLVHEVWFKNKVPIYESYHSKDGGFELCREICENGIFCFEGIVADGYFTGLSTWRYCNGQLRRQGVRYRSHEIGIWKEWNEEGKLIKVTDYKKNGELKLMPVISKQ